MKKNYLIFGIVAVCVLAAICLIGCNNRADKLTSSQIKRLYSKQMKDNSLQQEYVYLSEGYYETDSAERCTLRKLEAAGLVTVQFERFAWWEKITSVKKVRQTYYNWWGETQYSYSNKKVVEYNFEDHIMATVALTPEAKKLIVKNVPEPKELIDKDMKQPVFDPSQYPECSVSCVENWPLIKNPFIEEKKDTEKKTEKKAESKEDNNTPDSIERKELSQYEAYMAAKDSENRTPVTLKGCKNHVVKARNVQIIKNNGITTAVAEVIVEKNNVSDAYRTLYEVISGTRTCETVHLTYYNDKGWVLQTNPLMEYIKRFFNEKIATEMIDIQEAIKQFSTEKNTQGDKEE